MKSFCTRIIFLVAVALFVAPAGFAAAQFSSDAPLSGYAWSSNIGWISFSGPGYEVVVEPSGDMTGYAWSSNIGWIQFGGLSAFPAAGGNAVIDLTTDVVTGWARACAGTAPGDCSSMTNNINGWDGWISLSCDNTDTCVTNNYGLNAGGESVSGYAWGSMVVGWIDFTSVSFTAPCAPGFQCLGDFSGYEQVNQWCEVTATTTCSAGYLCDAGNPNSCISDEILSTLTVSPGAMRSGGQVEATWSTSNASACTLSQQNPGGVVSGTPWSGLSGTETSNPISSRTVFSLSCTDIAGVSTYEVASTTVRVLPNLIET